MSVSKWAYDPKYCDGEPCVGDCDLCDKPSVMEDKTDYIKREDAIRAVVNAKTGKHKVVDGTRQVTDCMRRIKDIPSADVVKVVRCKDCLHGSWCEDVLWCNITDEPMTENDFCSKGDRI